MANNKFINTVLQLNWLKWVKEVIIPKKKKELDLDTKIWICAQNWTRRYDEICFAICARIGWFQSTILVCLHVNSCYKFLVWASQNKFTFMICTCFFSINYPIHFSKGLLGQETALEEVQEQKSSASSRDH